MLSRTSGRYHLVLLIFFVLTVVTGNLDGANLIEWESYEGADHYLVEFRQNGESVAAFRSEVSSLPVLLPPGQYEFRVLVMSPFGKEMISTQWEKVYFVSSVAPVVLNFSPEKFFLNSAPVFTARIAGYREVPGEDFEFQIKNDKGQTVRLSVDRSKKLDTGGNIWEVVFEKPNLKELSVGKWHFSVRNSRTNQSNTMDEALIIHESLKPSLKTVIPRLMRIGKEYNELVLKLAGLEENAEVHFIGPSVLNPVFLDYEGKNRLLYNVNLKTAKPGWYGITLKNPSGTSYTEERAFRVKPPKPVNPKAVATRLSHRLDSVEPSPISTYPRSLLLGYTFSMPIVQGLSLFEYSLFGFMVGFSQDFYNDLFRRSPALTGLGWEIDFRLTTTKRLYLFIKDVDSLHFMLNFGMRYITPWQFPIKLLLRFGMGFTVSVYTSAVHDRASDIGGHTLMDLDSLDLMVRLGAGVQWNISSRLFFNTVFNVNSIFFYNQTYLFFQPGIEGGFRW